MFENILCPQCQRCLRLPADFQAAVARCPSCKTAFPIASASAGPPLVLTTLPPPPRELPTPARPRSVQRPARHPCLIVALVVSVVFLIMGVGVSTIVVIVWRMLPSPTNPVAQMEADDEDLREQVRQTLKNRPPPTEDEITRQVKTLLDELGAALQAGNPGRIVTKFDQARLVDELAAMDGGALPLHNPRDRRDARRGMGQGFATTLAQHSHAFQWDKTEIRKVEKLNNDEAVVIARHTHPNGASLKMRWWATRRNGDWEIYDYENLDTAWRLSAELVSFMGQGLGRMMEIGPALRTITEASHAVIMNDVDGAEKKLAQVKEVKLPPRFESLRQLVTSEVLLQRGQSADALKALEEVQRLQPDLPLTDFLRGVALNRLGKPDQALKHLRAYRDLLGEDDAICREVAEAFNAQGRFADTVKEYRKALDFNPKDEELFAQLATLLFQENEDDQLQKLLDTRAKNFPDSLGVARFRYRLLIRRNNTAQGIVLFKSTLAKPDAQEFRSQLVSEFLGDMLAAGKPLEAYRAAPDAVAAFRQLAPDLIGEDRWDDLRQLLQAHREKHAEEPWLAYYQADLHQHDQAWDKAAKVLGEALKRDPKDTRESLQNNYVFVLYQMGRWRQAYAEVEPHNKTFAQLANLMFNEKKGTELEALVRAHKPNAEDDPEVPFYEARAKILTKKWAEAVPLFRQAYQKQDDEIRRDSYQMSFLWDMAAQERWLEGYRAAVDKGAALDTLAGQLLSEKKEKELAALLEEHRKSGGGEPWYSFYMGELLLLRGDARQAVKHFAEALAKGNPQDQWRLRDGLFSARVRASEALIAYKEHKADQEAFEGTFSSLARLCSQNKDIKQLQALLDVYRKDKPDDPSLVCWELELLWLKHDYEDALRLLKEHQDDLFSQQMFRWKAEDYRIRCLVKLNRRDEAIRVAEETVKQHRGDRLLLVLAHAASVDVPQTIAAMGKLGKDQFFVRRCYEDDDLGPILKSKKFEAFRTKFPEPKQDKAADER